MTTIERKKTYTLSRKSEHSDSTNLEDLMQENEPNLSFWEQVWAMEGWISFWVWLVGGACIIASPAAIIWISNSEKYKLNLLLTESTESLRDPLKQVVRFSVWLTFSWSAFICIRFYLLVLPGILIRFITTTYGELSERAKVRLEYIPAVRVWLTGALWMVASVLIYRVVFFQMTIVNEWHDIFNFHIMMMWFSVVLLAQRIFVQKIATDFHKVAYRERIKESKKCLKILEKLKKSMARSGLAGLFDTDPNANTFDDDTDYDMSDRDNAPKSASFFQKIFKKKEKEEVVIELEAPIPSPVQRSNSNPNRQASTRKRELPREESSNKSFVPFLSIGTRKKKPGWTSHLSSDQYAFELSQKLFRSLHDSQTGLIYLTNLDKYFDTPEQAAEAFGLFDKDGNGSITISELRWTIVKIYREKRHLQESMIDLSHALGNLNQILYVISLLTAVLLSLPIYGISINAVLPFTSILVALSFIFGGSAKSTFDCIVFLFVTHPFDTGDRVLIDDKAYIVEEMSILNTLFIMDGKRTYFPNTLLMQKPITNVRRSGDMTDYVSIKVNLYTPEQKLKELHTRMVGYVKDHSRYFKPVSSMQITEMQTTYITVRFSLEFKGNAQDYGKRLSNRTDFMLHLKKQVTDLEIKIENDQEIKVIGA